MKFAGKTLPVRAHCARGGIHAPFKRRQYLVDLFSTFRAIAYTSSRFARISFNMHILKMLIFYYSASLTVKSARSRFGELNML